MITARQLAQQYDLSVAALWRGDAQPEQRLAGWLSGFRCVPCPPEPATRPDAVSLLGGGGTGIRWYTTPEGLLGYAAGQPTTCYRVPPDAVLPRDDEDRPADPVRGSWEAAVDKAVLF